MTCQLVPSRRACCTAPITTRSALSLMATDPRTIRAGSAGSPRTWDRRTASHWAASSERTSDNPGCMCKRYLYIVRLSTADLEVSESRSLPGRRVNPPSGVSDGSGRLTRRFPSRCPAKLPGEGASDRARSVSRKTFVSEARHKGGHRIDQLPGSGGQDCLLMPGLRYRTPIPVAESFWKLAPVQAGLLGGGSW